MKNVQVLDCTLRDGGRIIDCKFEDKTISSISKNLMSAGIDIIEVGFLRDEKLVDYKGNSTFFTEISQIKPFIPKVCNGSKFVVFIDFDMYDFSKLETCDKKIVTGIRVGFTKKQFETQKDEIKKCLLYVKGMGYDLYVQGVNSLAYSDRELLDLVDMVNEIKPYSFGIVDTYGAMYLEDIVHIYSVIDYNLTPSICIDIHSHNNFQSSFAFAQEIIRLANGKRNIILDATLNGMGKCAGNLNTELIVDFLMRKKNYDYDINLILDTIDRYLYPMKKNNEWGYTIPAFMAGIYKAHPNNIIYLTEKYRLNSRDIKYIISSIDEEKRQQYDYDNIKNIYKEYCEYNIDDTQTIQFLKSAFENQHVLVLAPGRSIESYNSCITDFMESNDVSVICVNFIPQNYRYDYLFFANTIHWEKISEYVERSQCILTSNIHADTEGTLLVNYTDLIMKDSFLLDNSTIMLLNLLKKTGTKEISLAGFDGLKSSGENYINTSFPDNKDNDSIEQINNEVKRLFNQVKHKIKGKINFVTPSLYEEL